MAESDPRPASSGSTDGAGGTGGGGAGPTGSRDGRSGDGDRPPGTLEPAPGPGGPPVIGQTLGIIRNPFETLQSLSEYGDVVRYSVAGMQFHVVLHPEYVEQVLVEDHDKVRRWAGGDLTRVGDIGEQGLLLTEGDQWRRQRLLIQQSFTPARVESYAEAMVEHPRRAVDRWENGEEIALKQETSRIALGILTDALFDLDLSDRRDVVTRAAASLNENAEMSVGSFLPDWLPTPSRRSHRTAMRALDDLVDDLIEARREDADDRDDLLSVLLAAETDDGETLSEAEVRDQMVTFLFAGHETTGLSLAYTLLLLAHHPDRRERLDDELSAVLDGDPPSPETVGDLEYTERVIRESLRLFPPAYAVFREATEDLAVGGYRIPEGSKITVPQYHVHRDPRFFDDPHEFRPERWTDEFEADLPEYAYFPFGGGPRHCIGMRFAMMELKHVLPTVLQRVAFDPLTGLDLDLSPGVTLQPAEPIEVRVRNR